MSTQLNVKIEAKLKREAEGLAKKFGLSLSAILRMLLIDFVHTKKLHLDFTDAHDTPASLTGAKLTKILTDDGWDPARAERHGKAYEKMLEAEKRGKLVRL